MTVRTWNRLTIVAVGVTVCVLTGASILTLPASGAGPANFLLAFAATCFAIWLGWRKGLDFGDMLSFGGSAMIAVMFGSALATLSLWRDRVPFTDDDAWIASSVAAPVLALFVPLAITQFNASYPGRLRRWLKPSEEATRAYMKQLIKEAEHRESLAKYNWEGARQSRKNLEDRLAKFEAKTRSSAVYR